LLANELVIMVHSIIHPDLQNLNPIPRFLSVVAHQKTWCTNKKNRNVMCTAALHLGCYYLNKDKPNELTLNPLTWKIW